MEKVIETGLFIACVVVMIVFVAVVSGCVSTPQTGERSWHSPIEKGVE
jgi:hypothetical protein